MRMTLQLQLKFSLDTLHYIRSRRLRQKFINSVEVDNGSPDLTDTGMLRCLGDAV
jgi:hypothetical protein